MPIFKCFSLTLKLSCKSYFWFWVYFFSEDREPHFLFLECPRETVPGCGPINKQNYDDLIQLLLENSPASVFETKARYEKMIKFFGMDLANEQ